MNLNIHHVQSLLLSLAQEFELLTQSLSFKCLAFIEKSVFPNITTNDSN